MNSYSFIQKRKSNKGLFISIGVMMLVILSAFLTVFYFQQLINGRYIPKLGLVLQVKNLAQEIEFNRIELGDTLIIHKNFDEIYTHILVLEKGGKFNGRNYLKTTNKDLISRLPKFKKNITEFQYYTQLSLASKNTGEYSAEYYTKYKEVVAMCKGIERIYSDAIFSATELTRKLMVVGVLVFVVLFFLMIYIIYGYFLNFNRSNQNLLQSNQSLSTQLTENLKLVEQNKQTNVFLTELLKNQNEAVLFENLDRRLIYINQKFLDFFVFPDFDPNNITNYDCRKASKASRVLFNQPEVFELDVKNCLENKIPVSNLKYELTDGRYLECNYIPVFSDKVFLGHLWHYLDITEQVSTQKQIEESERQYRYLFELNPNPMWIYDKKTLNFLHVNQAAVSKYGYSREEFLHLTVVQIRPEEERNRALSIIRDSETKQFVRIKNVKHTTKKGDVIEVDIYANNLKFNGIEAKFIMINDVTEVNQARNQLLEYQELLEQIIDNKTLELTNINMQLEIANDQMNMAMDVGQMAWWVWDRDLDIIDYSPLKAQMLGYTREEIGTSVTGFTQLLHPDDFESTMDAMRKLLKNETDIYSIEYRLKHKSGEYIWFKDMGKVVETFADYTPMRIVGVVHNINERKQLETKNKRWAHLIKNANWGVYVLKAYSFKFELMNDAFARIHGYTVEEMEQITLDELIADELKPNLTFWMDLVHRLGSVSVESVNKRKDGTRFPVMVNISLVKDEETNEEYVVTNLHDISERSEYEEKLLQKRKKLQELNNELRENADKLKQSESHFRTLISNLPDIDVYLFDRDLRFLIADGTEMRKLGLSSATFEGRRLPEIMELERDNRMFLTELYSAVIEGKHQINEIEFDDYIYFHQGIPLRNEIGEVYGGIYFSQNISKIKDAERKIQTLYYDIQKQNEDLRALNEAHVAAIDQLASANENLYATKQELLEEKEKYIAITENFPDGKVMLYDKELRYFLVNGNLQTTFTKEDLLGKTIYKALPRNIVQIIEPHYKKALVGEKSKFQMTLDNQIFELQTVPINTQSSQNTIGMVLVHNITDRKTAENRILQALEKEKDLNELKTGFIATASHQFRTPLTTIQSSLDILKMYFDGLAIENKTIFFKHYQRVMGEIKRLTDLMNDVLMIGKLDAGKTLANPTLTDIIELINNLLQSQFEDKNIIFNTDFLQLHLIVDPKLISHAISNLLSNAVKYRNSISELTVNQDSNFVVISVIDDGIGIPKEEQSKIFSTFFRASNTVQTQGTGLGLVIVKQFVELHSGSVEFESEPMKKTVFRIKLPKN